MLFAVLTFTATNGDFTTYPAFRQAEPPHGIEAVTDRGPIAELIVRCPTGVAILSYSKVEKVFCTPRDGCFNQLTVARNSACTRR